MCDSGCVSESATDLDLALLACCTDNQEGQVSLDTLLPLPWQQTYHALEMYFPRFVLFAGGLDAPLPAVVSWDPPVGVLMFSSCPAGGVSPRPIEATTTLPPMSSLRPDSGDMLASDILRLPRSRGAAGRDKDEDNRRGAAGPEIRPALQRGLGQG